jgi:signal transduction histidine kinase
MSTVLDAQSVLKASQAIASELVLDRLLTRLMKIMIENAGAQRGVLILEKDGHLMIEAEGVVAGEEVLVLQSVPVETRRDLPISIIRYVERMKEQVVVSDATQETRFPTDPYITRKQPKSILCAPLVKQGKLIGILYLENNLATGAFTSNRIEVLNLLAAEAAVSIENARLYRSLEEANEQLADYSKNLERKVEERTYALEDKNRELEMANQQVLEATQRKSQFLAGMSHQLRTPMNAIIGFTRLVLRRAGDLLPERQRDNLVKVKESADYLLNLINELLDLSKIEAGRMEVHPGLFDVKQFIQTCCETVAPLIKPEVQLHDEMLGELGQAHTDEDGLRHIVLNLLSNALKFTEAGEVVVRVRLEERANGEVWLVIAVADTGVGIAAEAIARIFEEFQQAGGVKHKGTGLGLPIAKRWAELLGGSIHVESELKRGSTFTVTIPVVYPARQETSAESTGL